MLLRQSRQSRLGYAIPNESVIFNGLVCWGAGGTKTSDSKESPRAIWRIIADSVCVPKRVT